MAEIEQRTSFQAFDSGRDVTFEVFQKVEGSLDIIGVEHKGFIYYIILLEGFNSHKSWLAIKMDDTMSKMLNGLIDTTLGTIEVLGDYCPLLSQSILNGMDKRYNNGAFINVAGDWFLIKDFWFSLNNDGAWLKFSEEVNLELIERVTRMFNEIANFNGFGFMDNAKIAGKDLANGYKKVRPYLTLARIITSN